MTLSTIKNDPNRYAIDVKLLLNILTDGYEYACRGFWGQVETARWMWWYVPHPYDPFDCDTEKVNPDLTGDTVLLRIRDDEDGEAEEEDRPFADITLRKLAAATLWALDMYSHLFSFSVREGVIEDIDYDATGADVIIQKIVLGDVVYG